MQTRFSRPLLAAAFGILLSTLALAQAPRTWVSGVGDDANPCSRTAPCKTFAGAISKTAPGGVIDALDSGGFGAVTITKSITLDGGDVMAGIQAAGTNAINVSAAATDVVVLRHLTLDGDVSLGLAGVRFNTGASLTVEDCVIENFSSWGIDFEPTSGATSRLQVTNTIIRNNAGGIIVGAASNVTGATIERSTISGNGRAAVRADNGATVVARNTVASNGNNGFVACTTSANPPVLTLENSSATNNTGYGVGANPVGCLSGNVRMSNTIVTGNATGLTAAGSGTILSWQNNKICCNGAGNGPPTGNIAIQ